MSNPSSATRERLIIACCSSMWGDRMLAPLEMVEGGPIDFLVGDYLAELTMLILWKSRQRDPSAGYAKSFLPQMEAVLGTCLQRGIRIVVNAGGLNPKGLADALRKLAGSLGLKPKIAYIEGDDLLPRLGALQAAGEQLLHLDTGKSLHAAGVEPITANVYFGGWGIAQALSTGADVVICPRVTDSAVLVGPAAWHFGWKRNDWDALAGALVAGHLIECGPFVCGGNFSFFQEIPGRAKIGYPIAEVAADGSAVITKHKNTGGLVTPETVTAQLLYETQGRHYLSPDVIARLDTIRLESDGHDRVLVYGTRGEPAPPTSKVCINYFGGYRNSMTMVVTGLDIEEKVAFAKEAIQARLPTTDPIEKLDFVLMRTDKEDAKTSAEAQAFLTVTARDRNPAKVGRAFSDPLMELFAASYPGFFPTTPPTGEKQFGVFWPALVSSRQVTQTVVADDGSVHEVPCEIAPIPSTDIPFEDPVPAPPSGPTTRAPLGRVVGARSGDKGGNVNIGVWARTDKGYAWLRTFLDVERLRDLIPDIGDRPVRRETLPNLRAMNFVVVGFLGDGVASTTHHDPWGKALGEYLRSRVVDVPIELRTGSAA